MVADLPAPHRPLAGGHAWTWRWRAPSQAHPWAWCRIYHQSTHTRDAVTHRRFGPLARLDPHTPPASDPAICPEGRSVLYVASNLMTALGEVFGDFPEALVCPRYRVALLRPVDAIDVLDLHGQGAAMRIGALPSLATGAYSRARTQEWARAIYEDQPVAGTTVHGVYYAAAHTSGPALALWNTESMVEGIEDRGRPQDYALADVQMWGRVAAAAAKIKLRPTLVSACPSCR